MPKLGKRKRRQQFLASMLATPGAVIFTGQNKVDSNGVETDLVAMKKALLPMPDPEESWAVVELYRLQHGELPPQDGTAKPVQISEGLKVIADMVESTPDKLPPRFSVATVLRYVAKEIAKQDGLEALSRKIAGLNPTAGEIGAGMLANLVAEARKLTPLLPPS